MTEENTIDNVFDFWKETENDYDTPKIRPGAFCDRTPEKINIGQQRKFFQELEGWC